MQTSFSANVVTSTYIYDAKTTFDMPKEIEAKI
jgi:hypothetical protein